MHDVVANAGSFQLVFHNDDDTPQEFIAELLRNVFGKSDREIIALFSRMDQRGHAACGPYPAEVAASLLQAAEQRVRAAGHPLRITSEAAADEDVEPEEEFEHTLIAIQWHFADLPRNRLVTTARQFPAHMRADVQVAVDTLFASLPSSSAFTRSATIR
jgi:ATP-dependent Clp protease adapter protein ClpS